MDRNALLAATRAEFMHAFIDPLDALLQQCSDHLFNKADIHPSPVERRKLMDARDILIRQSKSLKQSLKSSMEQLINRSFQTAYSTFRPSFSNVGTLSLSLVDTSTVDDELRIDTITKLLRNEAEEQLRDLNIRIALLFEQDNIKERENPFRPYLFSRCIASATEQLDIPQDISAVLTVQMAEALAGRIADIYGALNALLAGHGIAAELQLKIRRSPANLGNGGASGVDNGNGHAATTDYAASPSQVYQPAIGTTGNPYAPPQSQSHMEPTGYLTSNEDLLMQWVQQQSATWGLPQREPTSAATTSANKGSGWLRAPQQVGQVLRKLFIGQEAASPTQHAPITQSLALSIEQMTQTALSAFADFAQDDGSVRNLMMEQRQALKNSTSDLNQQMIIDVVAMLFEFILRDNQVPAEVRAQLGRLQILVLKHALQDPALFNQKNHPARLLVNRIGSISLGLKHMDPSGERVTKEIVRIVESLLSGDHEGLALFEHMLDELDAFIARELRSSNVKVERAVKVMEHAVNRTLRFARISAAMADSLSTITIDGDLQDFLVNHWPRVIERAEREDPGKAERYRLVVPDLIWSIAPKTNDQERKQLVLLLQPLLHTLREGLNLLDWSPGQQQNFLNWLAEFHTRALRAGSVQAVVPSLSQIHEQFTPLTQQPAEADMANANGKPVEIDQHVLSDALSEMESQLTIIDQRYEQLLQDPDHPSSEGQSAEAQDEQPLETDWNTHLQNGVMIEINLDGHPALARLNWFSEHARSLVLSIDDQSEPAMISLRLFKRLLQNGRAKFLETEPLFERAIQSLLQTADQMGQQPAKT
ncbi:hypothetical protein HNQ59_001771 [Chitinivorax tropicus]|uniref:DUF1631 domain-containing protein n=1 Tax=Chitinivorax tropicus TaxID=714531 RepID=A0A840MP10_9PROT|nr:DUF1631 family protein [Chitinivorax tropicus]MBB5018482.1 hypothetical protein [Chitinivorax tropicus]